MGDELNHVVTAPVKPGDVLDRKFLIERIIGAGGMGVVVAARHIELGQRVAIKFMLPEAAADPQNAARFAQEARAAVQLRSQHAGRVLDVGRKGSSPYMVMELLDGNDLDDVVRASGGLPYRTAVDYVLQACEAVAEAHTLGIVHRDIKPKNVFLTRTPAGEPCVKVLDFGLAKMRDDDAAPGLTSSNSVFGSPHHMSPEQMRSTKSVTAATDIWAFGVTLYELVTGVLPFHGATLPEVCASVLKERPRLPSELAPDVPSELDAIVLRCLEKEPARRFASVVDLAFALEPFASRARLAENVAYVADAAALRRDETIPKIARPYSIREQSVRSRAWLVVGAAAGSIAVIFALKKAPAHHEVVPPAAPETVAAPVILPPPTTETPASTAPPARPAVSRPALRSRRSAPSASARDVPPAPSSPLMVTP